MQYSDHPYNGKKDYQAMRKLLQAAYAINGPLVYATVGDLDWWRAERLLELGEAKLPTIDITPWTLVR